MVDPRTTRRLRQYALYISLALITIFLRLLPVNPLKHGLPGPDLMVAFTFACMMRRPDYLPPLLIVGVFFLEDLVYWRPVGLWPLMMLLATEFLRARVRPERHMSIALEMLLVGAIYLAVVMIQRLTMGLVLAEQPALGPELMRWMMTMVAYPFVVMFARLAFGLNRPTPGEAASHRMQGHS